MKKPIKIVIIGAGSLFFGRQAVWAVNHLPGLKGCILALVDTDDDHLDKMTRLARMAAETSGSGTLVEPYSHYREALSGADFVVLSFSKDNAHYRRIDCEISAKYGIRMCSGDTIGPGGIFRAMREFPQILEMAHAVEELCPEAWLINYVNPSAVMGIGLMRHSKTRTFALCDTHHLPAKKEGYLKLINEDLSKMDDFDLRIAGVNHFTWILKAELEGVDVRPQIRNAFLAASSKERDEGHSKARFNNFITAQLSEVFGAIPTCTGHTKEYVSYYQGKGGVPESIPPLTIFDADEREGYTQRVWDDIELYVTGKKPMDDFHSEIGSDHATDIINTMITEDGRSYYINRTNSDCIRRGGAPVGNMPADSFFELECMLDRNGPRPLPVGDFPLGLRALQFQILDVHELTIEAIVNRDWSLLIRALAMDPLVHSIATARAVLADLYEAQCDVLPGWPEFPEEMETSAAPVLAATIPQLF